MSVDELSVVDRHTVVAPPLWSGVSTVADPWLVVVSIGLLTSATDESSAAIRR